MILGCIDIGSNTTRLLVAEADDGSLRELLADRAFTRIGHSMQANGRVPAEKIEETAAVVREQARMASAAGAEEVVAVATAAIREAPNRGELVGALEDALGQPLRVLTGEEEAGLSFLGATRTLPDGVAGQTAVVDVGGGSTEIAVGDCGGEMEWCHSLRIGSGLLADAHIRSDPPAAAELDGLRDHVTRELEGVEPPAADRAVAVGGTATSLSRLVGPELSHEALEAAVEVLSRSPVADVARRYDLDAARVKLLPAGILLLQAVSDCLETSPTVARGGLREGVILEAVARRSPPAPQAPTDGAAP